MGLVRHLEQLNGKDMYFAGGKGASLGKMLQAGFPVPPGFVILSTAFEKFLEGGGLGIEIDSALHNINPKKIHTIENASGEIRTLIFETKMPKDIADETQESFKKLNTEYVAVRSSATAEDSGKAAWAGQLESYLNTTEKNLLENVKKCWASLFTPRALFYRFEKGLHQQKISVAVVVQKMIQSEVSGIAFSLHPATQDRNQLVIEAGFGLGEAIVSGQITPDCYVVKKCPQRIIDKNIQVQMKGLYHSANSGNGWRNIPKEIGAKQTLSDEKILALSDIIICIENHCGFPCDIEWATEHGKFHIVQNRPITTLHEYAPFSDPKNIEKMVRQLDVFPEEETLEVTLLNWGDNPYTRNIGHWVKYVSTKLRNPREVFIYWDRKIEDEFLAEITTELLKRKDYFKKLKYYFLNSYRNFAKFTDELFQKIQQNKKFYQEKTNRALVNLFYDFSKYHKPALAGYYVAYDLANLLPRLVKKEIQEIFPHLRQSNIEKMLQKLSLYGINSAAKTEELEFFKNLAFIQKIYRHNHNWKDRKIQSIIFKHWYKFVGCIYNDEGNFYTLQDYQEKFFQKRNINTAEEIKKLQSEIEKDTVLAEKELKKFRKYPVLLKHINWLRTILGYRNREAEFYHSYFVHALDFFNEISHRLSPSIENLWLLSKKEIINGLLGKEDAHAIAEQRKKEGFTIKQVGEEIKVWTGIKKEDWHEQDIDNQNSLIGTVAYKGMARGRVKVIFHPGREGNKLKNHDVLVTSMTTPSFVPLMKKAAAIITDEGGLLCHAAIVAREMKKLCIIGTKTATQALHDNDLVEIDGNMGIINILK